MSKKKKADSEFVPKVIEDDGGDEPNFFACIPHQIEADWDEKWGPLLEGFPLNILYVGITNNKQESSATPSPSTTSEPEVEDYYPEDETCFVIVGGIRPKKQEKERLPTRTKRPSVEVCYWPDLATFHEDSEHKEMWYFTKPNNRYWIRVVFDRKTGRWQTEKYKGDTLVRSAFGSTSDQTMLRTTMGGPEPEER